MSSFTSGIVGVAMGAVFWGSNFIVLKGYEGLPDDGMCFVFLMATGVLIAGIGTLFANPVVHGDFEVVLARHAQSVRSGPSFLISKKSQALDDKVIQFRGKKINDL